MSSQIVTFLLSKDMWKVKLLAQANGNPQLTIDTGLCLPVWVLLQLLLI